MRGQAVLKIRFNTYFKNRIDPHFILENRNEWQKLKRLDYLMEIFVLIFKNLKLISLYSLLGHRVVCSFNMCILKPFPDCNLILLIAINKSVFVLQQRGLLIYYKLSKFVSFSFLELGFISHLVQFVLRLMSEDKICYYFHLTKRFILIKLGIISWIKSGLTQYNRCHHCRNKGNIGLFYTFSYLNLRCK